MPIELVRVWKHGRAQTMCSKWAGHLIATARDGNVCRVGLSRRADGRANVTVCFVNGGSRPVHARWIRPDDDSECTRVRVQPERFDVTGRAEVNVLVGPVAGRLRAALEFRLTDDDGHAGRTVVYVRGAAGPSPRETVRVRPAVAPPSGHVCAGRPASYRVQFRATSGAPVRVRRGRLYAFDAVSETFAGPYENAAVADFEAPIATHVSAPLFSPGGSPDSLRLTGLRTNYETFIHNIRWHSFDRQPSRSTQPIRCRRIILMWLTKETDRFWCIMYTTITTVVITNHDVS